MGIFHLEHQKKRKILGKKKRTDKKVWGAKAIRDNLLFIDVSRKISLLTLKLVLCVCS
jgi:hypothetical protein